MFISNSNNEINIGDSVILCKDVITNVGIFTSGSAVEIIADDMCGFDFFDYSTGLIARASSSEHFQKVVK